MPVFADEETEALRGFLFVGVFFPSLSDLRDLSSPIRSRIEPAPLAVKTQSPNH